MPNRSAEHSLTLIVEEAAALIGVFRSTAYDLVATDELPAVHLRRRILVPASALADLLGVSLVEVYGALNRLRGRTGPNPRRRVGSSNDTQPEGNKFEPAERVVQNGPGRLRRTSALVASVAAAIRDPTHGEPGNQPISSGHTLAGSPTGNLRAVPPLRAVVVAGERCACHALDHA